MDRDGREAIIKVFAESPGLHLGLEVAVGGGDDADIDVAGLASADGAEFAILQNPQQLGLEGR